LEEEVVVLINGDGIVLDAKALACSGLHNNPFGSLISCFLHPTMLIAGFVKGTVHSLSLSLIFSLIFYVLSVFLEELSVVVFDCTSHCQTILLITIFSLSLAILAC
jgi:hypothetical protein